MRVITGRHRPGLGVGMKLPFQHYNNDEEDNKSNSSEEEEKHDNRGTEDEESSGVLRGQGLWCYLWYLVCIMCCTDLIVVSVSYHHHPCLVYDRAYSKMFY